VEYPPGRETKSATRKPQHPCNNADANKKNKKRFRTEKTTVPAQNDDSSDHKRRQFRSKELYSSIPDSVRNRPPENAELSLSYAGSIFLHLVTSDIYLFIYFICIFQFKWVLVFFP
jgi:hypothetical protein